MIANADWGPNRQRVERFLTRIDEHDATINSILTLTPEMARADADKADRAEADGRRTGSLHGMVVTLKDNIDTAGIRTTSGSKLYENYVPEEDAVVWARMRDEGAILIGKAGLHECVFGPTSQNVWFGRIRNPWNQDFIAGGSSGGSGAAPAADFCDLALGTDTGGSVRIPSALCGLAGLRPTMGAVSNRGVRPISPHFDTVGPMAKRVEDVAKAYAVMMAYDGEDETSRLSPFPLDLALMKDSIAGYRIGLAEHYFNETADPDVAAAVRRAAETFADLGAEIVPVEIEGAEAAGHAATRMVVADAAGYYQDAIDNTPEMFGDEVMRRFQLGYDVTGREYAVHSRSMYRWQRTLATVFERVDMVLTPTVRSAAFPIAQADDLLEMARQITPFTMAWAMGCGPNLVLPCGFTEAGMPITCQLAAAPWSDDLLLRSGIAFQGQTAYHETSAM